MLSCEVISDLRVVYASGEASAETRRLVEEHLARCTACREAFGKEALVEEALAELEPMEKPANGHRFIARTRRLLFVIGAGTLLLFACVLTAFERVVMEDIAGITLPHLPGSTLLWLAVAATMLVLYISLLLWRRRREPGTGTGDVLLSVLTAIPLLVTALVAYHLVGTGTMLSVLVAALFLLIALVITFVLLPHLRYMTLATVLVLLLVNGVLLGEALAGVVTLGVFSWQTPAALGHPAEGVTPKHAARVDMQPLGLEWVESTEVTWVDNVWIGPQAEAVRATHEDDRCQVFLTVIQFESRQDAGEFFTAWKKAASSRFRITHFEINLPGLPDQGHVMRSHNAQTGRSYSAWQARNWVTIVEVPGPLPQAGPLARDVKELVARGYRSGGGSE